MTSKTIQDLEAEVERLVREHLVAQRRAAAAAVERAFAAVAMPRERPQARAPTGSQRRTPGEMSGAVDRLYEAIRANPGQTITFFAAQLGQAPRSLSRPMGHLKRSGRVRAAGQRNHTRYFPMGASRSS